MLQTDRRTDGRTTYDSNTAFALRASRGKTYKQIPMFVRVQNTHSDTTNNVPL